MIFNLLYLFYDDGGCHAKVTLATADLLSSYQRLQRTISATRCVSIGLTGISWLASSSTLCALSGADSSCRFGDTRLLLIIWKSLPASSAGYKHYRNGYKINYKVEELFKHQAYGARPFRRRQGKKCSHFFPKRNRSFEPILCRHDKRGEVPQ